MPTSAQLTNILQYTTLAVGTLKEIANAGKLSVLGIAATYSLAISNAVETNKSHRDEIVRILEQIHKIICSIIGLYCATETDGALSPGLVFDIAKFTDTLQRIHALLSEQQGMGKVKQFFKKNEVGAQLKACSSELQSSLELLTDQCARMNLTHISRMEMETRQFHDQLLDLLTDNPSLTNSDTSSLATNACSNITSSSLSLAMLPPPPQILHGRESELEHIISLLKAEAAARIAILGTGGMGKTTLAAAVLNHPDVHEQYSELLFVPCHMATTSADLLSAIASHMGLEEGTRLKRVLQCLGYDRKTLLILDNLETPWESAESHGEVEKLLSQLADLSNLSILVTMRGAERPSSVQWTRPFLPPLAPISDSAALQTFIDIADGSHEKRSVEELLECTGNLPLAVTLISSTVADEGCDSTLERWRTTRTRVLSDGYDKKSSLEISIMLSLSSPRMTSGAQDLLSLLSVLPDGLSDVELVQGNLPISNILACKATLLRTSLALVGHDRRLKLLVPIREYISISHPPPRSLTDVVQQYLQKFLEIWNNFENLHLSPSIVAQLRANVDNLRSLLAVTLNRSCPEEASLRAVIYFNQFLREAGFPRPLWDAKLDEKMQEWKDTPLYEHYLTGIIGAPDFPQVDARKYVQEGITYFQTADPLERARWYSKLASYYQGRENDLQKALKHRLLALDAVNSMDYPVVLGGQILGSVAINLIMSEDALQAQTYAERSYEHCQRLGYRMGEISALALRGRCAMALGDFKRAARFLEIAVPSYMGSELEGSIGHIKAQSYLSELHLLKTEYADSRAVVQASVGDVNPRHPPTMSNIFTDLNVASIDIMLGSDLDVVAQRLETIRIHLTTFIRFPVGLLFHDMILAQLLLYRGDVASAESLFKTTSVKFLGNVNEGVTFCVEHLADPSFFGQDLAVCESWSIMLLAFGWKIKDRLAQVHALRCLGKVYLAQGDADTARNLLELALEELTARGVHRWCADCMVRLAAISESHGDIEETCRLLRAAQPLFQRSGQQRDLAGVETKLASFSSSFASGSEETRAVGR